MSGGNNFKKINESVKRIDQLIQQLAFPNEIYEQIQVLSADIRKSKATFSL